MDGWHQQQRLCIRTDGEKRGGRIKNILPWPEETWINLIQQLDSFPDLELDDGKKSHSGRKWEKKWKKLRPGKGYCEFWGFIGIYFFYNGGESDKFLYLLLQKSEEKPSSSLIPCHHHHPFFSFLSTTRTTTRDS